jgi:hypothetical protein
VHRRAAECPSSWSHPQFDRLMVATKLRPNRWGTWMRPGRVPAGYAGIGCQRLERYRWRPRIAAETVSIRRVTARRAMPAGSHGGTSAQRLAYRVRAELTRASKALRQPSVLCGRLPVWPVSHSGQAARSRADATMASVGTEPRALEGSSFGDSSTGSMDAPVQRAS